MGFAPPENRSYGFQDYPRWLLWLPNVLASGELQLGVWAWSTGGPGGGVRLVRQGSWRSGVFGVVVGSWRQVAISQSGGPGDRAQSVGLGVLVVGSSQSV